MGTTDYAAIVFMLFVFIWAYVGIILLMKQEYKYDEETKKEDKKIAYKEPDLGKCTRCDRHARWETHTRGNVCNTCHDYMCGLE